MQDASTLVIIGAGGHGRVVADAALASRRWRRIVATDGDPAKWAGELLPGVACMPLADALALPDAAVHVAVGRNTSRQREAGQHAGRLATVVHPAAVVSPFAEVAAGCFVAATAVVAPRARVGTCAIVNHGAVVDHDVTVGAYSHVAPHATLGGESAVGEGVLFGAGAVLLPGVRVCDGATIGAGAVVRRPVTEAGVYAGVPAGRVR